MTVKDIKEILQHGEHLTLEAKRATFDIPKSIWETYSAFANTIGGLILLGVNEDRNETNPTKRFTISGVNNPRKIILDFWNTINSNKVSQNILSDTNVELLEVEGEQVVCIQVPQADWRVKPIYLNDNVYKGSFKRNNEGDYHCSEVEVKAMIRDANENGNDGILIEN